MTQHTPETAAECDRLRQVNEVILKALTDLVDDLKKHRSRRSHSRSFGHHGSFEIRIGVSGVSEYHLKRLCWMVDVMEDTVHDLRKEIKNRSRHHDHRSHGRPIAPVPSRPNVGPVIPGPGIGGPFLRSKDGRFSLSFVWGR